MKSHLGVGFIAVSTTFFATALYSVTEAVSADSAFATTLILALGWALGAIIASTLGNERRHLGWLRAAGLACFALAETGMAFVEPTGSIAIGIIAVQGVLAGFLLVTMVCSHLELHRDVASMRASFVAFLAGKGAGFLLGGIMVSLVSPEQRNSLLPMSAVFALIPLAAGHLVEATESRLRLFRGGAICLMLVAVIAVLSSGKIVFPKNELNRETPVVDLVRVPYLVRAGRGLDVFLIGRVPADAVKSHIEAGARGVTAVVSAERLPPDYLALQTREGTALAIFSGSGRRRMETEARRFDLIQIFLESEFVSGKSAEQTEALLTVEALRNYLDHLKPDGMLQFLPPAEGVTGRRAQAVLATVAEAWKRSGRKDIDLHSIVVGHLSSSEADVMMVTLKDVLKIERDRFGEQFRVGQSERGWVLPSDSSGPVMTDDQPYLRAGTPGGFLGWILGTAAAVMLIALTVWIAAKERRRGVDSRWQTFSIVVFFGGLGLAFSLFSTFFEMRAMRDWGRPDLASAVLLAALAAFSALGAQLFAGHPQRRYGVRIQPLANFVFAAVFAFLAGAVVHPLVASGGEIFSFIIGTSMLIPYGLLGGAFFPNAMEEAAGKLQPKSMYLLWASFAAGTCLGLYIGTSLSASAGLSAVFLAGVFVFAWVAIIGGLVRPFSIRKPADGS